MNKQQLANKIWESANKMRSKIEANEYKDYILGFIFYKYLSDQEVKFLKEKEFSDDDIMELVEEDSETVEYIQRNIGYFISYENLFSTWITMGKDFDVSNVRDALSAFNRLIYPTHKKVFDKVFDTLQTGLSKLGDSSNAQTKAISSLLQLIKDIPMDGKQDYDVLGFIYEFLISQFAANAGKKAGEFYTPHEVSVLMSEIVADHLKGKSEIKIYDPTSGSGSLLINIGKSVSKYMSDGHNIKYYAQELKENTYNLTRMNLVMRGIKPDNIVTRNGDTLEEDWPFFDENDPINTYNPLYVDAVVSNPPYSQAWDPSNKEHDPRYSRFGIAPKGKADYAFLLHDLFHIKPDGIMTIVLPHGVLFRGGEEGTIRKNLIENNHIDAIIGLPANIFFGTGIPTIVMVLKQKRENTDTLIIDASKGFIKEGKNNKLRASDIKKIADTIIKRESIEKFSMVVTREEIRNNDYNLNIPRYVDSSEAAESWDIYASMFGGIPLSELEDLKEYWEAFPTLKDALFTNSDIPYVEVAVEDIKQTIKNHENVVSFENAFASSFEDFHNYLYSEWIEKMSEVEIGKSENEVSENIFARLEDISLIDKYEAYQLLDNEWGKIAGDLEMIQSEGFGSTKKVDPNLIVKKKDGKEQEIQDGWIGHIIPFELVQKEILSEQYLALTEKENRLAEIPSLYEELIDSLTEEEKESDILNDSNDAFVGKEVTKKLKELKKEAQTDEVKEFIDKLSRYEKLSQEEKDLKKEIKKESAELHMFTKETIENLSDDKVCELLDKKWIGNLIECINKLPDTIVNNLVSKIQALQSKYATTYFDVQREIRETERLLSSMIDELEGNEFDMKGLSEFKSLLMGE
ncbi:type I restriction-modification system subunit M [Peptostreptococcus porci]|uniref:type I restriction-modification system subunit M n=1 Tax=Peptostreptococcus porci TaxID=2652282 RepID=UPI002A914610|nr:type I restriction-modification system subunit M [Peptostreptococcus porci]MDY6232127.1 type I restriction-modification system subunit M [Peptostreptococcus porci]